jgi:nicotinate-nucleotide adenylyltransferase
MKNKKVGIMGGTFDPIHTGHLVVANEVLNFYGLEEIIFIPAGDPPHKKGTVANSFDRYIMTEMAVLSNNRFKVSDVEIKKAGKSYTLNTLLELTKQHPDAEFYFITGTDAVIELPSWREPEKLLNLCKFVAVSRPGISMEEARDKISEINKMFNSSIELFQAPMLQISSTDIRQRFMDGKSTKYLLPESVEQYIIKNNLYGSNDVE